MFNLTETPKTPLNNWFENDHTAELVFQHDGGTIVSLLMKHYDPPVTLHYNFSAFGSTIAGTYDYSICVHGNKIPYTTMWCANLEDFEKQFSKIVNSYHWTQSYWVGHDDA